MNQDYDRARERWHRHLIPDPSKLFDTVRKNQYRIQNSQPRVLKQGPQKSVTRATSRSKQTPAPVTAPSKSSEAKKKIGGVALFFLILTIIQLLVKFLGKIAE